MLKSRHVYWQLFTFRFLNFSITRLLLFRCWSLKGGLERPYSFLSAHRRSGCVRGQGDEYELMLTITSVGIQYRAHKTKPTTTATENINPVAHVMGYQRIPRR